ncbi:hypothetical protein SEA_TROGGLEHUMPER_95 [Rhodococcus phage Trogglehumper]|uniref:Uncharacterized protein n=1 Tax=Rhodococcus phage Trogglehumper TaxID=3038381 RepID=A0AAF0GIK1_9CAUD|nr:hypothetical protein SEA_TROGGLEHUMPER_95 [Rhodococcus phage Trogglehumper]
MHYIVGIARTADMLAKANGLRRNEYRLIQLPEHIEGTRFVEGDTLTHVTTPGDWKAIPAETHRALEWVVVTSGFKPPYLRFPD